MEPKIPAEQPSGGYSARQVIYTALFLIGTGIILSVALFKHELRDGAFVLLGVLCMELGIFKLAQQLLPDQRRPLPERRKYLALRALADQFLPLVRHLNVAALQVKDHDTPENRQAVEEVRQHMQSLVERMVVVAGKTNAELAADARRARQAGVTSVAS